MRAFGIDRAAGDRDGELDDRLPSLIRGRGCARVIIRPVATHVPPTDHRPLSNRSAACQNRNWKTTSRVSRANLGLGPQTPKNRWPETRLWRSSTIGVPRHFRPIGWLLIAKKAGRELMVFKDRNFSVGHVDRSGERHSWFLPISPDRTKTAVAVPSSVENSEFPD
jgi:hypothetical protein